MKLLAALLLVPSLDLSAADNQPAADTAFQDLQGFVKLPKGALAGLSRDEAMQALKTHCAALLEKRQAFLKTYPTDPLAAEVTLDMLMDNPSSRRLGLPALSDNQLRDELRKLAENPTIPRPIASRADLQLLLQDARKIDVGDLAFADWNQKVDAHIAAFPGEDQTSLKMTRLEKAMDHDPALGEKYMRELTEQALPPELLKKTADMQTDAKLKQAREMLETNETQGAALLRELADAGSEEAARTLAEHDALQALRAAPLAIKFTDLDGAEVSLEKLKGKVVLIDFWATWCGPCVAEAPHIKEAYEALHEKGFEVIGISLDKDPETVRKFVKENGIPWPQYCDNSGTNPYAGQYKIESIPTMWLVGKDGLISDLNARENLRFKVENLLKSE